MQKRLNTLMPLLVPLWLQLLLMVTDDH